MRVHENVVFSLLVPTRGLIRLDLFKSCVESFVSKAVDKNCFEFVVTMDLDDKEHRAKVEEYFESNDYNFKIITIRRNQIEFSRDYMNHAAQCSSGKYIWALNDDVENVTEEWDRVLKELISAHPDPEGHLYISVDDSTHTVDAAGRGILIDSHGSCFPMLSRKSCEAMNGLFPTKVNVWGADSTLFRIFKHFPDRMLRGVDYVKLLHHSHNNFTREQDETSQTGINFSRHCSLNFPEEQVYVNMLRNS